MQTKAEGRFEDLRISGDVGAEVTFWIVTPLGPLKAAQTAVLNSGFAQVDLDFPRIVPETISGAAAAVNGDGVVDTRNLSDVASNLGLGVPPPIPQPTTVTIGPSKDNTLYEDANGSRSNGVGEQTFVGVTSDEFIRRGLVEFNIAAAIPSGASITEVQLTLHMSKTRAGATAIDLHIVSEEWGEGNSNGGGQEGQGAVSANGDATWVHTFFNDEFWSSLGGDFNGTASNSASVAGNGFYTWGSTAAMVADVQGWLDDPSTNHGWLLRGNESSSRTAKRFDTRENSNLSNRPMLTITFIP